MPKFMFIADYKTRGTEGLIKDGGTGRRAAVKSVVESLGGKLEAFYFAYGHDDAYVIVDLPSETAAQATSIAVNASGAVTLKTIPLITPEDIDAAVKAMPAYRAPGAAAPKAAGKKR
jgi:uncharacterized protein with GYD domain